MSLLSIANMPGPSSNALCVLFRCVVYRLKAKGRKGKTLELEQPRMRMEYVLYMGGVDSADQMNGSHAHGHKVYSNFWRRMFDAKIAQALTNAFLIFRKWVELLIRHVEARLLEASGELLQGQRKALKELTRLAKVERAVWDEEMATMLMAKCNVGSLKGGRSKKAVSHGPKWGSVQLKSARHCLNYECQRRSLKGCTCEEFCTRGAESGVLMCEKCFLDRSSHEQAAAAHWEGVDGKRTRSKFAWLALES